MHQPFPFQSPQKFSQIGIFGWKISHLATLQKRAFPRKSVFENGRCKNNKTLELFLTSDFIALIFE
jgi:hypothetical protein